MMILKVMKPEPNDGEYLMVCGVNELWVLKHKKEDENKIPDSNLHFVAKVFDEQKPVEAITELLYRGKDGDWYQIMFNTVAYVCNEEGKTVEKIYG